jgi:glycine cleavage system H protein
MSIATAYEWVTYNGKIATVGITYGAQKKLGEVMYVELPPEGAIVKEGEYVVLLESTKAAVEIYSPVTGVITHVNEEAQGNPQVVNEDPEGGGWLYQMEVFE